MHPRNRGILAIAEAIEAGLGIGHLPCFEGDGRPALRRLGPVEPELGAHLWLLTRPDLRRAPRVRAFLDFAAPAIAALRGVIEGEAGRPFAIAADTPSVPRRRRAVAQRSTPG